MKSTRIVFTLTGIAVVTTAAWFSGKHSTQNTIQAEPALVTDTATTKLEFSLDRLGDGIYALNQRMEQISSTQNRILIALQADTNASTDSADTSRPMSIPAGTIHQATDLNAAMALAGSNPTSGASGNSQPAVVMIKPTIEESERFEALKAELDNPVFFSYIKPNGI